MLRESAVRVANAGQLMFRRIYSIIVVRKTGVKLNQPQFFQFSKPKKTKGEPRDECKLKGKQVSIWILKMSGSTMRCK